jgi:hypothetical protein
MGKEGTRPRITRTYTQRPMPSGFWRASWPGCIPGANRYLVENILTAGAVQGSYPTHEGRFPSFSRRTAESDLRAWGNFLVRRDCTSPGLISYDGLRAPSWCYRASATYALPFGAFEFTLHPRIVENMSDVERTRKLPHARRSLSAVLPENGRKRPSCVG